jgi:hypothetical protein
MRGIRFSKRIPVWALSTDLVGVVVSVDRVGLFAVFMVVHIYQDA